MHSTETLQHHDTEPPIETGTSWWVKILGIIGLPFSLFIGTFPWGWALVGFFSSDKGSPETGVPLFAIVVLVAFSLLMGALGFPLLLSAIQCFALRVRVDDEGLNVRCFRWRYFPWGQLSCRNLVKWGSHTWDYCSFLPDAPGDGTAKPRSDTERALRASWSPASFGFITLPKEKREAILRRIHAHLPDPKPPVLPDLARFRVGDNLSGKQVALDAGGLSIRFWGRERRYAWDSVKEMVIWRSSPKHGFFDHLSIRFDDEKELGFMQISRFVRGEPVPDKATILGYFLRHAPPNRIIDLTPGVAESVKSLEYQLKSIRRAINSGARIAVWSFVAGVALLGIGILWLFLSFGEISMEILTSITFWYMVSTIFFVGVYGIVPSLHGLLFRLPAVQKKLHGARAKENLEEGRRGSQ
jgi:hypothetical protein